MSYSPYNKYESKNALAKNVHFFSITCTTILLYGRTVIKVQQDKNLIQS